jgi:hypothetical protein
MKMEYTPGIRIEADLGVAFTLEEATGGEATGLATAKEDVEEDTNRG